MSDKKNRRRPAMRWAAFFVLLGVMATSVWQLMAHPRTPLPPELNPLVPLNITHAQTVLTHWKMARALRNRESCIAALQSGADVRILPDHTANAQCHIRSQVRLIQAGDAKLKPVKTRCQTALRLAMWERHGVQPAAQRHLGQRVGRISHFSSYNCRAMRTTDGGSRRMSTHATADAIDISGFTLSDGTRVTLLDDWDGAPNRAAFLRDVQQSACRWFRVALGPDYNALHANHFHLQHTGWGLCR